MQATPLWKAWGISLVVTHRNGSMMTRVGVFALGLAAFLRELVLRRPSVVHLHASSYGSFARKSVLAWASRWAGVPVVMHIHGSLFREFYSGLPSLLQRYVRRTLEATNAVVALGYTWQRALQEIAPRARIIIVPNAVEPRNAVEQPGPGQPVRVLFLGEIENRKGAFMLLDAWRRAVGQDEPPAAQLVMAGGGAADRARAMAAEFDIADQVEVMGWISPPRVESLLQSSQVLVLPSSAEGQPMAVLEAMAHGHCVVATDVGGIPDLIDETSGILLPVGDSDALVEALKRVLADAQYRSTLGCEALKRVHERFDVNQTWRELDSLYEELAR
jgi:glycosyltransferase involved in cell wall biosynthesis